jgi:hypothetical protein
VMHVLFVGVVAITFIFKILRWWYAIEWLMTSWKELGPT